MVTFAPKTFGRTFTSPFRTSAAATSPDVPGRYMVALNGRGFQLDLTDHDYGRTYWGFQTIAVNRAQSDVSNAPAEGSLSRDELWRRAFESWHHGAGQSFRDRTTSDEFRFKSSLGVNPWTRDALTLLPSTSQTLTTLASPPLLTTTDTYIYANDTIGAWYSTDGASWSAASGLVGLSIIGLVSDGSYIYASTGADIYRATPGGAFSVWNTLDASLLAFVNGRLMAAGSGATANVLYNITTSSPPSALYTHPNPNWTWTAFASGPQAIYAAGYVGDTSAVYSINIRADGTGLDVPVVALQLPDGELCYSLAGYLGFLAIGTSAGLRLAALGSALTAGSPLAVGPVRCLEGQDRFVWFGWSNVDSTHTGLGRADLTVFTSPLTPAYASDLMALGVQGNVTAVVTFKGLRVFAVSGIGVFTEQAAKVVSGNVVTGWVTYGLPDRKVLEYVDVRTEPLDGTVAVVVSGPSGAVSTAPLADQQSSVGTTLTIAEQTAERFSINLILTKGTGDGPNIVRVTTFANPAPARGLQWTLPLLLAEEEYDQNREPHFWSPRAEIEYVRLLADSGSLCTLQVGSQSYSVFVVDYLWRPDTPTRDLSDWNGTLTILAKQPSRKDN